MKIILIIFIFGLMLTPILFENSFAQTTDLKKKPTPKIFFQIKLYDKDGNFYGYIQPNLQIFDMDRTLHWLASYSTNSTVVFEGQRYTLMKLEDSSGQSNFEQLGGYFLNLPVAGVVQNVFYAYHDSFLMTKGDTEKVYWEALIPLV